MANREDWREDWDQWTTKALEKELDQCLLLVVPHENGTDEMESEEDYKMVCLDIQHIEEVLAQRREASASQQQAPKS